MTSLNGGNGFFAAVLGFVVLANMGCATTIAGKYPHLDRRAVCVLPPEIEPDSTEFVIGDNNVPISNFHPEMVDRVAADARTVFEYDPDADPSSVRDLPAPYNALQCPERFSPLLSKDAETPPLPEASVDLVVHERRPEVVPRAIADKLANCASHSGGKLEPIEYTVRLNVYVTNAGQAVSALLVRSTLGDRKTEACLVNVLRNTQWPQLATAAPVAFAAPALKTFLAQPAPAERVPNWQEESGIRRIQPQPEPPTSPPKLVRVPLIGLVPLPAVAGGLVFFDILLLPNEAAPAWVSELNPITRQPYTGLVEYEQVHRLSPQQILQAQQAHIKATKSQPPPASTPSPTPQPEPEQDPPRREKPDKCPKIKKDIHFLIYEVRPPTTGDFPAGYQGLAMRWVEFAENRANWGPKPDGSMGNKAKNHLAEYQVHQKRLLKKLDQWYEEKCNAKGHTLPDNAEQYAAQEPQLGPGKPLKPAPTPTYSPPTSPAVSVPPAKRPSK